MNKLLNLDTSVFRAINDAHIPIVYYFMFLISLLGELATIWFFFGAIILYKNKKEGKKIFIMLTLAILVTLIINHFIIAYFMFRVRPYIALDHVYQLGKQWRDSSFPSGHVSSAMAATVVLGKYYRKYLSLMLAFVFLTMISRVYLGMHYPLDVLGGVVVGLISGYLVIYFQKLFYGKPSVTLQDSNQDS